MPKSKTIELEKLGAVRRVTRIPVPEDGGVVVCRGRNGVGKSTTLNAIDKLMRRPADAPTATDGYDRGRIEGLGVTMTVGRSTRYSGELEVVSLDAKLSVADLVDPGIDDPRSADAKRMKAILAILNVSPDVGDWLEGVEDEETAATIRATYQEAPDLLTFASRLKKMYEATALGAEKQREQHKRQFDALMANARVAAEEEPTAPPSDDELAANLTKAQARVQAYHDQRIRAETAAGLAASIEELKGQLCDEASLLDGLNAFAREREQLLKRLAEVDASMDRLSVKQAESIKARAEITRLESKLAKAQLPPASEGEEADAAVTAARDAFKAANETRRVIHDREVARVALSHVENLSAVAEASRKFAKSIETKLGNMVGMHVPGLSFDDGRLIYQHATYGTAQFAELSHGERSLIAVKILIDGLGSGGLATLPQEFWEGLDPINRGKVDAAAKEAGVVLITAECSDDPELTSETFSD